MCVLHFYLAIPTGYCPETLCSPDWPCPWLWLGGSNCPAGGRPSRPCRPSCRHRSRGGPIPPAAAASRLRLSPRHRSRSAALVTRNGCAWSAFSHGFLFYSIRIKTGVENPASRAEKSWGGTEWALTIPLSPLRGSSLLLGVFVMVPWWLQGPQRTRFVTPALPARRPGRDDGTGAGPTHAASSACGPSLGGHRPRAPQPARPDPCFMSFPRSDWQAVTLVLVRPSALEGQADPLFKVTPLIR